MGIDFDFFTLLKLNKSSSEDICFVTNVSKSQEFSDQMLSTESLLLFTDGVILEDDETFFCELINTPFKTREYLIKRSSGNNLYEVSLDLFDSYRMLAQTINKFFINSKINVRVFCCIYNYDFCLISSSKDDLKIAKIQIDGMLNAFDVSDIADELLMELTIKQNDKKREQCISSQRRFVKYNPQFRDYMKINNYISNIKCDSTERKMELSLFSSLLLKDLIEETHLYWMYESGEVRQEISEISDILSERDILYFDLFEKFCCQANDDFVYHDWIWCLVFLTQTLLSSLKKRSKKDCDDDKDIVQHENFFGFVPIVKGKENNEVMSLYTRHISRKFCHGFLLIPEYSIYNLPDYLPAYIHEFFHYIPPKNRTDRNQEILKLVLHTILTNLRNSLTAEVYTFFLELFTNEIVNVSSSFGFTKEDIFDCDSMEFWERITCVFDLANHKMIYDTVALKTFRRFQDISVFNILRDSRSSCLDSFSQNFRSYICTYTMFMREIRSDIAMCLFFDIDLEQYIKILAKEPMFARMPKEECADSTIMRFGFMCRYLLGAHIDKDKSENWINTCCSIIDKLKENDKSLDDSAVINNRYDNLSDYLKEYAYISIESNNNSFVPKGESLLELSLISIISEWEKNVKHYASHEFSKNISLLYRKYLNASDLEKYKSICGMRFLFRDLYCYNSQLDKK